jgi:hypothetical protein
MSIQRSNHLRINGTVGDRLYSERSCFEADQSALVQELKFVGNAIEDGATEMAMIAAESVFDQQVSKILYREAGMLHRMGRGLKDLRLEVARARLHKHGK